MPEQVLQLTEGFIPPQGGYQKPLSYQKEEVVFDATAYFCDRFIDRRSRTRDRMVQAARAGENKGGVSQRPDK
jgi:hypothetical protein